MQVSAGAAGIAARPAVEVIGCGVGAVPGERADGVHFASDPQVNVHTPLLQTWPAPHTLPHVPQSALSVAVFAQ